MSFAEKLATGLAGESDIARHLVRGGWQVLPAYQVETNTGKGPRLFGNYGQLISPDLLVFNHKQTIWVEAKSKSAFTWHRNSKTWQTGIDRRHWLDYVKVSEQTPFEMWIMFLHKQGTANDTPEGMVSPAGLFGNNIRFLMKNIHHESDLHGRSGMVYWTLESLKLLAELKDVCP